MTALRSFAFHVHVRIGHVECVHLLEGHSIDEDSDLSDDDVHDFSDDDHALSDSRLEMNDQREHEMSMAEAFVSIYISHPALSLGGLLIHTLSSRSTESGTDTPKPLPLLVNETKAGIQPSEVCVRIP